ncbi:MAG: DUF3089 domain-containing protein [Bacteroidales bacterium]|nr:DUF3089 domain-containing protein [Bacteroidales bacterium]
MAKAKSPLPYLLTMLLCSATLFSCHGRLQCSEEPIPVEPDYSDSSQWYIVDRGADVDLFYIVSTETDDYNNGGCPCHYADTYNDSIRRLLKGEMTGVDHLLGAPVPPLPPEGLMESAFNYYSPYYRQCTMESFVSDSVMNSRMPLALADVRKAFEYYLRHYNQGRPFIIAGFSQGAIAVTELLKNMDDDTYRRLVAAYVIGFKVTDDDIAATTHIVAARDSDDLGVTVCYNSVRDNSCTVPLLSEGCRIAINPVNWRTDATPAMLPDSKSGDTLTVTLDTNTLLLHVDGYSRNDYMLPLIGCEGNYHCLELSLYRHTLKQNMALRAKRYMEQPRQNQ